MIYATPGQVGMYKQVQAGTPLNSLQELGGWSNYEMVLRYAHLAPEHLAEYANNILDNGHIKPTGIKKAVSHKR